ncbi:MAG: GAF domain-containing SpoIIE family protein phosphatase [Balneolaceae bacterium]|nr:GAF domain-containing SpoIIE family protein phosphatase [Balneolaceae bacterium]
MSLDYLTQENKELQLAVSELTVLNDVATAISSTQPVEKIIDQIVLKCIKHLNVEEGTVSLHEPGSASSQFQTMIRRQDSSSEKVPIKLDSRLTGWMLKKQTILLSNNIREDDRFNFLDESSYSFRSILCAPLLVKGNLIGYLAVFNKKGGVEFSGQDKRLLSIIASQSAQVIENARLYEEEKALLSLQEELRLARDIQLNLLPDSTPQIPGVEIAATTIPAMSVGGDYYDFLDMRSSKIGFCVGDITGKGMPAAMLMANLQATLRSQVMSVDQCDKCLESTNKLLFRSTESTKFATLFLGVLNYENNILEFANGGHDAPLLFRSEGEPELLNSTGLLLGVMEDSVYSKCEVTLGPGDLLLVYSDGITEAMDKKDEEFGLTRLIEMVKKNREKSADDIMNAILEKIKDHADGHPQSDDITLILIKKK